MKMRDQVERLKEILENIEGALKARNEVKNTFVEQVLRADDIVVHENGALNITQNQYVVIHNADKWINEAKGIAEFLLGVAPSAELPLPDAVYQFKKTMITEALDVSGGNISKSAELLGMERRQLSYFLQGERKL